jgi:hypothetical protein
MSIKMPQTIGNKAFLGIFRRLEDCNASATDDGGLDDVSRLDG